jgi:hypothetical protein
MLDFASLLLGLLNLRSTWRFVVCIVAAVALFALAWVWLPVGGYRYAALVSILVLGAGIGARWQTQHDRQANRERRRR